MLLRIDRVHLRAGKIGVWFFNAYRRQLPDKESAVDRWDVQEIFSCSLALLFLQLAPVKKQFGLLLRHGSTKQEALGLRAA